MNLNKFKADINSTFKTSQSRFILSVGLKIMLISVIIMITIALSLLQLLRLNYLFFKTQAMMSLLEVNNFIDYVLSEAIDMLPLIFAFHILLFGIGCYVGWILIRPFHAISKHCEEALSNVNAEYTPEMYSNYNLLTRFSELFFVYLRDCRINKERKIQSIPSQFSKIHRPSRDAVYFLHFSFLLLIVGIVTLFGAAMIIDSISESIFSLAMKSFSSAKEFKSFLMGQMVFFEEIYILIVFMTTVLYGGLAVHLYDKMSGAAFGVFSTMRSYMKGNYTSRVHLLGFEHVRDYTRNLNQFLNTVEREIKKVREE